MNKTTFKNIAMALVSALIIGFSGCKGKDPEPTKTITPPATTEQYFLMNNLKVTIKNPVNANIQTQVGDTILTWSGNKPSTLMGDSTVYIKHAVGVKRGTSIIDPAATEFGEAKLSIIFGETISKTSVNITSGDYKLEKVNGIWYSVLKNGKAEGTKGSTAVNYTGVEFRIAWPSTFK